MNKKTMYIIVAVLVVVIVVAGAGILLMNSGGGGGEPTPTATPTPASSAVADASSLQFTVDITHSEGGDPEVYTYYAKNIGEDSVAIRVDMDLGATAGKFSYIIDSGAKKSWMTMDEGATWTESVYTDDQATYAVILKNYMDKLIEVGGTEDYTYTDGEATVKISNIQIDPTFEESLFTAS